MPRLLRLSLTCCTSILCYCLIFGFVVSRPLVVDDIGEMLRVKLSYAGTATSPKIFVIAGSNARFSHRCAIIEQRLQRPCINLGMSADVGLDWVLDASRPFMRAGDMVYLPLELEAYSHGHARMFTGSDAAYRWRHDKASLLSRGPEGIVRAIFMFDLRTLVNSFAEMALAAGGFRRRIGAATLNAQGDQIGHTDEPARVYEGLLSTLVYHYPQPAHLLDNPDGVQTALIAFLDWCRRNGVTAVGGLPTAIDDAELSDLLVETLRFFYARNGAEFLVLANRSQYPRQLFYDTPMHLRQGAQMAHSELVADGLRGFMR
jgi:hypothetical protein